MGLEDPNTMLIHLPPEILLIVLALVDPRDILSLRQTCRTMYKISYEHSVWVTKLNEQEPYLPLPFDIVHHRETDQDLLACSANTIESAVVKGQRTSEAWPRTRTRTPTKLKNASDSLTLIGLKLVVDRWLVAVYFEGIAHIYDTHRDSPVLRDSLVLEENGWTSFSVGIDPAGQRLILAISNSRPPHKIHIYQIELLDVNLPFTVIRTISLPHYNAIQALDIPNRLVIVSTTGFVTVLKWDEEYNPETLCLRGAIFDVKVEDAHGWWNGVVGVGLLGSHVLVHKNRSLHVCRYKNQRADEPPGHILSHEFSLSFKQVSFSEYSKSTNKLSETTIYEISTFAYDVIQGLFQYTIRLSVPEASSLLPSLDVQLTGVYPLALGVVQPIASSRSAPHPAPTTSSPNFSPSPSFSHTHATRTFDTPSFVVHHSNNATASATDYSSRGFLSTHCMGPQGKRGIWVERKRTSTVRDLQIWCREPPQLSGGDLSAERVLSGPGDGGFPSPVMEMERRVVYTLHSYDLRDDITLSTFSELNGTIYLGHRSGDISVVSLEY